MMLTQMTSFPEMKCRVIHRNMSQLFTSCLLYFVKATEEKKHLSRRSFKTESFIQQNSAETCFWSNLVLTKGNVCPLSIAANNYKS